VHQLAATLILVGERSPAKPGQVALPREGGALPYRGFHCSKKALLLSKPVWRASANWLGVCPSIAQLRWNRLNKLGT